jgi:hypothetical protein
MEKENIFITPYKPKQSVYFLLIVLLIVTITVVISKRKYIIQNWDADKNIRCNPLVMVSAPFYGKDIINNTTECLTDQFKNELENSFSMIKDKLGKVNSEGGKTNKEINNIHSQHKKTKGLFGGLLGSVKNIFANVIINIRKDIIKGKSMIKKIAGLVSTMLYVAQTTGDTGESFINGPIYKILTKLGGFCFSKNVKIKLKNGEIKKIYKLKLNDVLENGSIVNGLVKLNNVYKEPFYTFKHNKNILVTETHLVFDEQNNKFIETKHHPHAILTDKMEDKLYCLVTSDHLIKIGNYTFWDYED